MECAVIGGGITGLALGFALAQRGVNVVVLEASSRAGGKIQSLREDGCLLETGPASVQQSAELTSLIDSLGLEPVGTRVPELRRWVVADGRLQPVPHTADELLRSHLLGVRGKARLALEPMVPRGPTSSGAEESVGAFARRRFGDEAAERLLYPQISSIYAADPDALSVASSFPWLLDLEKRPGGVLLGLRDRQNDPSRRGLISFANGLCSLTDSIAARLGDRLRLETPVRTIEQVSGGFEVLTEAGDRLQVDALAIATPAHAASGIVANIAPEAAEALASIPYVPVTLVHVGFPPGAVTAPEGYGFFVAPSDDSSLLGAVFVSSLFAGRSPDEGLLVSVRVGGARRPDLAALAEDELQKRVVEEISRLLKARTPPRFVHVFRHDRGLPQYTLGHRDRLRAIGLAEESLPGLCFAGSAYRGAGVPECVRDGFRTAERILRHLGRE